MDDRIVQFRLGLFVVIVSTALMALFLIYLFGELPTAGRKTIYVRFSDVTGVSEETPVRKNGILIGRVSNMTPVEHGVVVAISVDPQWKLYENEICRITNDNLFGDSVLQFVSGGNTHGPRREIGDGEYITGAVSSKPMEALGVIVDLKDSVQEALVSIRSAGNEVSSMAENLNLLVAGNQQQVSDVLGRAEKAFGRFDTAMVSVRQIADNRDLQIALEEALEAVPQLVGDAGVLLRGAKKVTDEAELNLIHLRGLTKPLGEHGGEIVDKLNRSADRLDKMLLEFQTFGEQLNSSHGTIGQLVHNPEIYQNLNRASQNIEELTERLRPIVNDARVAVDKVARNPRMLGVQGALQRRTSGIK